MGVMKFAAFAFVLICLAVSTEAEMEKMSETIVLTTPSNEHLSVTITPLQKVTDGAGFGCKTCASLTGQSLNILLNYILNAGVVGGCAKVCGNLKQKTEKTVCNLA